MTESLKLALAAVAGLIVGAIFASVVRPTPPDVKAWEARVVRYQQDSAAYERMLAVMQGERARLEDSARAAEGRRAVAVARADQERRDGARAKRRADSLTAALDTTSTLSDSLRVTTDALYARTEETVALGSEVGSLRTALASQIEATGRLIATLRLSDSVANEQRKRLTIADDLLRDRPKNDRCKVLWFDCPSRTVTFIGGAVLGVVGGVYVATR